MVVGCNLAVFLAVAVVVLEVVVVTVGGDCPGFELAAPLRPLAVLLPFLTVLRGVTSLPGVRRVARVAEVVTAVPLTRVPTRLCRWGARLPSPLGLLPFAEWFAGGPDRVLGTGAVPSAASGVVVETIAVVDAAKKVVAVEMSGPLGMALGFERNIGSWPLILLGSTRSVGT